MRIRYYRISIWYINIMLTIIHWQELLTLYYQLNHIVFIRPGNIFPCLAFYFFKGFLQQKIWSKIIEFTLIQAASFAGRWVNYLPEIVKPVDLIHGKIELPSSILSLEIAFMFINKSKRFPETITSLTGYCISPSFI